MSGTAFGIWALLVLHLSTLDTARPFTKNQIRRNNENRIQLKSCLLESEPEYRKFCEASTGGILVSQINPIDIATNILLTALLIMCLVLILLFSTINIFLYKYVNKGNPKATSAALISTMICTSALGSLFYAGIVPEATGTALIFQGVALVTLTFAFKNTRSFSTHHNLKSKKCPMFKALQSAERCNKA